MATKKVLAKARGRGRPREEEAGDKANRFQIMLLPRHSIVLNTIGEKSKRTDARGHESSLSRSQVIRGLLDLLTPDLQAQLAKNARTTEEVTTVVRQALSKGRR